jgi:hypothetical protein
MKKSRSTLFIISMLQLLSVANAVTITFTVQTEKCLYVLHVCRKVTGRSMKLLLRCKSKIALVPKHHTSVLRGPLEKFVDWRQCAAVMQREEVTVMPRCSGGEVNVVVA